MRNIVDFIIKNINSFVFIILLSISFSQVISRNYYQASKFNLFSSSIINIIKERINNLHRYTELNKENNKLINENLSLRNNLVLSKKTKGFLKTNFKYSHGKIIDNSIRYTKNFVTIDLGKRDGISINDGIVSSKGIIGIINRVSENFSSGISILNSKLKINAVLKKSDHFGSLFWNGKDHQIMSLEDIPKSARISIGDTISSGGMSSIFPRDILIGVISSFNLPESSNYYKISVKLFEDFGSLRNIYVVKNELKDEFNELKNRNE